MGWLADETGLERCPANYVPLTPLSHLNRAKDVFPEHEALVYGSRRYSYRQYHERVTRLASAMAEQGINPGDVVSTILPNVPATVETHFAVPACGAVLNAINTRLDTATVAYIFNHATPKIVVVDSSFLPLAEAAAEAAERKPEIVEVEDAAAGHPGSGRFAEYEDLLANARLPFEWLMPADEWECLTLNYTSGTTGRPKGVVYHHRGAYLMTLGTVISWRMTLYPRFLAIVPLFHCNGWNHSWMIPALGGTVVCCRDVTAKAIYDAIADEGVTHFGGAPIVLNLVASAGADERRDFGHRVEVFTAGAPPAAATLEKIERLNFNVTQVYGLTETYGHVTECVWQDSRWRDLGAAQRSEIKARQGVLLPTMEEITVVDDATRREVPRDGTALGEIVMRGNTVMKGYFRNPDATKEAFAGGRFRSGDIAVRHQDGYFQIADRSKDIIISGGENVSSVEVEGILMHLPSVSLCAVVAKPDARWGEVPFAFIELKEGAECGPDEIIAFCRESLAGFKVPKGVAFQVLPKTATGKIQKFELREAAKSI